MANPPQNKYTMRNDKIRDSQMSQDQAQQNWSTIRDAIHKIYAKQASTLSYEELYRTAYNLVLHKHGEILYTGVRNTTIELLQPIVQRLTRSQDEELIKRINQVWAEVKLSIIMIKDILMYMDKNYVPKVKLQSVEHLQTQCFQKYVVLNPEVKNKLISIIIQEIKKERDGQKVETTQLRQVIQMLVEVGISSKKIYENEFEKVFIAETQNYYRLESNSLITSHSCYAFLQKAHQRLNEELERVLNYLDSSSEAILIRTFLKEYVEQHALTLITMEHSGLIHMIRNEKYSEISLMHDLFSKVPEAYNHLTKHLTQFIITEGNKLVNDESLKHDQFVAKVIEMRDKMMNMFNRSFNKDSNIDLAIKNAFETFINQSDKTAMSLVYYLDDQFKKDFKNMAEQDVNDRLDKVIQIFRYLADKDIFEGFYKNSLAKRLLDQRGNTSDEQERQLVLKLKDECGFQYTQKLEVMFKDIKMSEETMLEFRGSQPARNLQIDLSVKVLTTGNWPNEEKDTINQLQLPKEIQVCISSFNKFYNNKHTGRLLKWKPSLAYADIRATLGDSNSKYELQASTFQTCILMLFNQSAQVTYQQICEKTNIPERDLKCNLIPLIGIKMLKKTPEIKEFNNGDVLTLNPGFRHNQHKLKLPIAQLKENKQAEKQEITEKVDEDRRHMVEATIVKVMKTRRRIEHNSLLSECTKILSAKFTPDMVMIKKRIESLIDREYLERDPDDRRFYKYIA